MKRNFLIATACLFLCAVAIIFIAGHTFEKKSSVPASSPRAVERTITLPRVKILPKFKRPYAP
ncbi:MAG: hypothetical protein IKL76_02525 [Clostridia bacterium]|nr:hypothetical protein [Clostridia bacterium]